MSQWLLMNFPNLIPFRGLTGPEAWVIAVVVGFLIVGLGTVFTMAMVATIHDLYLMVTGRYEDDEEDE